MKEKNMLKHPQQQQQQQAARQSTVVSEICVRSLMTDHLSQDERLLMPEQRLLIQHNQQQQVKPGAPTAPTAVQRGLSPEFLNKGMWLLF
jgi:hypothetical protein